MEENYPERYSLKKRKPPFPNDPDLSNYISLKILPAKHFPYVQLEPLDSVKEPAVKRRRLQNMTTGSRKVKCHSRVRKFKLILPKSRMQPKRRPTTNPAHCSPSSEPSAIDQFQSPFMTQSQHIKSKALQKLPSGMEQNNLASIWRQLFTPFTATPNPKARKIQPRMKSLHNSEPISIDETPLTAKPKPKALKKQTKSIKTSPPYNPAPMSADQIYQLFTTCRFCGYQSTAPEDLAYHKISHQGAKASICPTCKNGYHSEQELNDHISTKICSSLTKHGHPLKHICALCPAKFEIRKNLHAHYEKEHLEYAKEGIVWSSTCSVCHFEAKDPRAMLSHMDTHLKEKSFECPACNRRFVRQKDLRMHLEHTCPVSRADLPPRGPVIGNGNKRFVCHICSQTFASRNSRARHEQNHGDKYPCLFCPTAFSNLVALSYHIQFVHPPQDQANVTNPTELSKCMECGYLARNPSVLTVHMRLHVPEEPKTCRFCASKFSQGFGLLRHLRRRNCLYLKNLSSQELVDFGLSNTKPDGCNNEAAQSGEELATKDPQTVQNWMNEAAISALKSSNSASEDLEVLASSAVDNDSEEDQPEEKLAIKDSHTVQNWANNDTVESPQSNRKDLEDLASSEPDNNEEAKSWEKSGTMGFQTVQSWANKDARNSNREDLIVLNDNDAEPDKNNGMVRTGKKLAIKTGSNPVQIPKCKTKEAVPVVATNLAKVIERNLQKHPKFVSKRGKKSTERVALKGPPNPGQNDQHTNHRNINSATSGAKTGKIIQINAKNDGMSTEQIDQSAKTVVIIKVGCPLCTQLFENVPKFHDHFQTDHHRIFTSFVTQESNFASGIENEASDSPISNNLIPDEGEMHIEDETDCPEDLMFVEGLDLDMYNSRISVERDSFDSPENYGYKTEDTTRLDNHLLLGENITTEEHDPLENEVAHFETDDPSVFYGFPLTVLKVEFD